MSFKIAIFAAAVFACQVNAQMGMVRPFAAGFNNGIAEMAKPFVQLDQSVMNDYFPANRRPQVSQWVPYPAQMIPQAQPPAYDGYEGFNPGMPGAPYVQVFRPRPSVLYKPEPQFYPVPSQINVVRPPRPYPIPIPPPGPAPGPAPAPAPAFESSSSSEESDETYVPSSLLIQPESPAVTEPKPTDIVPEENINIPSLQRPLPIEDKE